MTDEHSVYEALMEPVRQFRRQMYPGLSGRLRYEASLERARGWCSWQPDGNRLRPVDAEQRLMRSSA